MLFSHIERSILSPELVGRRGSDLSVLANAGLSIVPTVMIGKDAFWAYQKGTLSNKIYEEALILFSKGSTSADLVLCCSPSYDSPWCENDIRVQATLSALRNAIERLFRCMMSPRSRADRIALRVPEEDAAPGILIQRSLVRGARILSRHAGTGQPTDEKTWRDNINNELPQGCEQCIDLSHGAESLLGRPLHIFFETEPHVAIARVDPGIMTVAAKLAALLDLQKKGSIKETDLVKQLDPSMFGHLQRFELDPTSKIGVIPGLAASPGLALGRVSLRKFKGCHENSLPPILFLIEATPDDVHDIEKAVASAGSIGGLTSHLAVICRCLSRPCVVGTQIRIDEKKRHIVLKNGREVKENAPVLLDGNNGILSFSNSARTVPRYEVVYLKEELRQAVLRAIQNVSSGETFRKLSIEDQKHIALLKYRLHEFGIQ